MLLPTSVRSGAQTISPTATTEAPPRTRPPTENCESRGHTNTRFLSGPPNRVTRIPPRRSLDPGMTRCARTANGATRREWSRQLPGTPRPPSTRAATPTPPNDALWGESRHDHPDAPARRRGHPWPLEHASAVPTIAGHGAQRAVHNPAAEAHATSTRRSDDQKPCSGRNLDRESPPIIHGAPHFRRCVCAPEVSEPFFDLGRAASPTAVGATAVVVHA